jgi:hypothetical protein
MDTDRAAFGAPDVGVLRDVLSLGRSGGGGVIGVPLRLGERYL